MERKEVLVDSFLKTKLYQFTEYNKYIPLRALYDRFNGCYPGELGLKQFNIVVEKLRPDLIKKRVNMKDKTVWVYDGLIMKGSNVRK